MRCLGCGSQMAFLASKDAYYCPTCGCLSKAQGVEPKYTVVASGNNLQSANRGYRSGSEKLDGSTLYDRVIDGVAVIETDIASGSGFLVHSSGLVMTNTHVVTDGERQYSAVDHLSVQIGGERIPAKVVALGDNAGGGGSGTDVALVKLQRLPRKKQILTFFNSDKIKNGETIYIIGNSKGKGNCITKGIVSDKLRPRDLDGKPYILVDCLAFHGNSGGPVLNEDGNVIGILTAGFDDVDMKMNYAVPSRLANQFLLQYLSTSKNNVMIGGRQKKAEPCTCPNCGRDNADTENGIGYCYDCQKEFGT